MKLHEMKGLMNQVFEVFNELRYFTFVIEMLKKYNYKPFITKYLALNIMNSTNKYNGLYYRSALGW